jgi:hypothetical protein
MMFAILSKSSAGINFGGLRFVANYFGKSLLNEACDSE